MGYTKIKAVKNHLARCLDYTSNPVKTERFSEEDLSRLLDYTQNRDKTEHQLYVTGFNCDPANACDTMNATRRRWGKDREGHVLAYHLIQSFSPGEVTPEQAHNIGCEFARRYLAERYEVTVSTHLDKSHLHNHIVFNSVAFVDGKMYRNQFGDYYRGIRQISDDLCRENRLKVIDPKGHGKNYAEWAAEKAGRPTVRGTIKADVDRALKGAVNWTTFVLTLNQMGYEVSYGHNVKYAKLRPKGSQRAIRFKSLGPGYSEQELRARLEQPKNDTASRMGQRERAAPLVHKKVRFHGSYRKHTHKKITGFMALYYHYLYLFGKVQKRQTSSRKTHLNYLPNCNMTEQAIVLALLNTGMRRGELAGLTWEDLDFKQCTVHVYKSLLVFDTYGYQLTTTKESNDRYIDVAPEFMEAMKKYYDFWKCQRKLMGASWQTSIEKKRCKYPDSLRALAGNNFVISDDHGWPLSPDSYASIVKRIGDKAGIRHLHPHMFRHTFVSILMSNPDIGVATVAAEAGHAQPSTTLMIYTQQYKKRRESIRNQLSRELYGT